jgi:hypothetical protein
MERLSRKVYCILCVLLLLAGLAVAGMQAPKRSLLTAKDVSACELVYNEYWSSEWNTCVSGSGASCYFCEYTDRNGSYSCQEAADPAVGKVCWSIDYQIP